VPTEDCNYADELPFVAGPFYWRPPSAAGEDRNPDGMVKRHDDFRVAAAIRGGRGSQLRTVLLLAAAGYRWRPPSAAAEDRNYHSPAGGADPGHVAAILRGGRESQRLDAGAEVGEVHWRPPSAAAEDRNPMPLNREQDNAALAAVVRGGRGSQLAGSVESHLYGRLAVAVRGGRGSKPHRRQGRDGDRAVAAVLRDGRGSQLKSEVGELRFPPFGGRRPAAAEDRNYHEGLVPAPRKGWRPPSGGSQGSQLVRPPHQLARPDRVAAIFRDGRGSQRLEHILARSSYGGGAIFRDGRRMTNQVIRTAG
jgi:hypothetical protein